MPPVHLVHPPSDKLIIYRDNCITPTGLKQFARLSGAFLHPAAPRSRPSRITVSATFRRTRFGFVIYNQNIDKVTFGDAQRPAGEVLNGVTAAVPAVKGGKAGGALDDGGYLTIGFAPPVNVNVLEV
jgi:hypothetical protein